MASPMAATAASVTFGCASRAGSCSTTAISRSWRRTSVVDRPPAGRIGRPWLSTNSPLSNVYAMVSVGSPSRVLSACCSAAGSAKAA